MDVVDLYLLLKVIHVLSSTLLFGTGLGIAFFMWRAHRSGDARVIARVAAEVVRADTWFTTPAVLLQPSTGLWMVYLSGYSLGQLWLWASLILYAVAGACWLPVVVMQWRMRDLAVAAVADGTPLPMAYQVLFRRWFALGWPAFAAVLTVFALMVYKPV